MTVAGCCASQHLAGLYIVAQAIMSLILGRVIATMPFVLGGAYSAWFYLRFLQPNASDPTQQCAPPLPPLPPPITPAKKFDVPVLIVSQCCRLPSFSEGRISYYNVCIVQGRQQCGLFVCQLLSGAGTASCGQGGGRIRGDLQAGSTRSTRRIGRRSRGPGACRQVS